jgi:Ca-activated chloride channel homolog
LIRFSALFVLFFITGLNTFGQQKPKPVTRVLIIFDASNSMYEKYQGSTRIETAKKMFEKFADTLAALPNAEFALRLYGHQKQFPPQDCNDTKLDIPFSKNNLEPIKNRIKNLTPRGTTPIAHSLTEAANDFPNTPGFNVIVLITDGIEECGGDPCEAARKLRERGIQFRPFVIGMGLSPMEAKAFDCVGNYFDIETPGVFSNIVNVIITQSMHSTSAQVNLLDISGNPSETNVNMTFYDLYYGEPLYNYVHTINSAGNPDTVKIDPILSYRLVAHTIPPVELDSVFLNLGKHNIIAMETPRGKLHLKSGLAGSPLTTNIQCVVRKHKEFNTLHVQEFGTSEKYLVGIYDLEILTLPRIYIEEVMITQNGTKTIEIPRTGMVKFNAKEKGYGSLYHEKEGKLTWIYDLNSKNPSEQLNLQPGNYRIVFRPQTRKESIYTVERKFKIVSDSSIIVNLY